MGDGSYTMTLEKRGYVLCNAWTPEASVEHPEAVKQLAIEFARAGGDVTQTYSFFSDDKRLQEWHGSGVPKVARIQIQHEMYLLPLIFSSATRSMKRLAKTPKTWLKPRIPW